jgi:hypothetical protein
VLLLLLLLLLPLLDMAWRSVLRRVLRCKHTLTCRRP